MESTPGLKPVALACPQCSAPINPAAQNSTVCQYCGSNLVWNNPSPAQAGHAGQAGQPQEKPVRGMHLKPFSYTDSQVTGLELFRMLIPSGWQFQGGCHWLLDNPGMPASVAFQVWNPQGAEAFEVLPNTNFTWSTNRLATSMFPPGSKYFGAEVRQPVGIQDAFGKFILPRFRSRLENLQIMNFVPIPDLPRLVKSEASLTPGASAEGGKLRICYGWQGKQYEEEIYAVVEVFRVPIQSMFGTNELIVWFIDFLFTFRAAAGRLDATADLFTVMIQSFKLNPQWSAAVKAIAQQLAQRQIQQIHHIGQLGQIYAQTGAEMRQQNLNDWYSRQATYDRLAVDRSRAIRDVDGFFDPNRQEVVELPSGYGHAWVSGNGEYILTEDPTFNPNVETNQSWTEMPQQ
jgi:hypothetical protein